jgi:hypothetical protein
MPKNGSKVAQLFAYQRALAAFSRASSETVSLERLFQHACAQISHITHIKHSKVLNRPSDTGNRLVVAGLGWKGAMASLRSRTICISRAGPSGPPRQSQLKTSHHRVSHR